MSDQTQSGVGTPDGGAGPQAANGLLPFFGKGGLRKRNKKDLNRLVKLLRVLQSLVIQISDAEPNQDGTFTPSGKLTISDQNAILELLINPSGGSGSGSGTLNYRGTYDPLITYSQFDIVRVQAGNSQGIWIRVAAGAATGVDPVFPEPVTAGGTNTWDMWTFGIKNTGVCSGSGTTVFANMSNPF